ncbi:hypothetical protein TIFTF001_011470 [Ficus carica]|uniref:Uncharacterized protein n=1 Tax=Ficus carica TaxID=3494 RepID=A0AA87ZZY4_FICCA|nr:hypothetical protein TIFTF001_011470 [Ficus carica]
MPPTLVPSLPSLSLFSFSFYPPLTPPSLSVFHSLCLSISFSFHLNSRPAGGFHEPPPPCSPLGLRSPLKFCSPLCPAPSFLLRLDSGWLARPASSRLGGEWLARPASRWAPVGRSTRVVNSGQGRSETETTGCTVNQV